MSERAFWLPVIAIISVLGTGGTAPALARGSGGPVVGTAGFHWASPAPVPRAFMHGRVGTPRIAGRDLLRGRAVVRDRGSIGIGPYPWPIDAIPVEVPVGGNEVLSDPHVIVIAGSTTDARGRTAPGDPPDYSYVAGCHAIPNGYHCDAPGNGVRAP